jgi:hypothetical protein
MKKARLLFVSIISIACIFCYGCKESVSESILGTWKYSRSIEHGIEVKLDSCEQQDGFVFLEDGTFTEAYYYFNEETKKCALDGKNSGTWQKKAKNTYTIDYEGEIFEIVLKKDSLFINYEDGITKKETYIRQAQ